MSIMNYSGGAVVAMVGKDCLAIASDHRFGEQNKTIGKDRPKVHKINDKVYVGLCGLATDSQTVYERLVFRAKLYKLREERDISPQAMASMTSGILYERRFGPYFTEPLIAGLDKDNKPYLSAMDLIGADCVPGNFVVVGTCDESLFGMCESLWKPDMGPEELFETISQALLSSLDRDCLSGWGASVTVLTKDGATTKEIKTRQD